MSPNVPALARLESWGLVDVFRRLYDEDGLFSWWDYRGGLFHRHQGMRIDLLLMTEVLARKAVYGLIDRNARKGQKPFGPHPGVHRHRHLTAASTASSTPTAAGASRGTGTDVPHSDNAATGAL